MSRRYTFILRFIVTTGMFIVIFSFVPYQELLHLFRTSHKIFIFGALCAWCVCILFTILRWKFLLGALGLRIPLREAACISLCGCFFNLFFPSFVAGDIFRGASIALQKGRGQVKKVASSLVMDRFSGGVALALVSVCAYFLGRHLVDRKEIMLAILILCGVIVAVSLIVFNRAVFYFLIKALKKESFLRNEISAFHNHLHFFKDNPRIFFKAVLYSIPVQLLTIVSFYISSMAFDVSANPLYFVILVPVVMLVGSVPVTIAGAGTREAASIYFFSLVGIQESVSLGMALCNLSFMLLAGLVGGIVYVSVYHRWIQPHS